MFKQKETTMKERFWKYANTKSEGTRVYNVLCNFFGHDVTVDDLAGLNMITLMKIKCISRKAAKLVIDVFADFVD